MSVFSEIDKKYDLILPVRVFGKQRQQKLELLFSQYYKAVRNTAMSFSVASVFWLKSPITCTYKMVLEYLHDNYPELGSPKIYHSAAMWALQARKEILKPVKYQISRTEKQYFVTVKQCRQIVQKMHQPSELCADAPYQCIPIALTEVYSDRVHLPFRCNLTNRTISIINGYNLMVPTFTPDILIRHAENLPDGWSPKVLSIYQYGDRRHRKYEVHISFGKDASTDEFKRTYKGTVRMIYQQWIKTTRKGGQNGKHVRPGRVY